MVSQGLNTPRLLIISGPTASGKTELAIKVAQAINGEIISADSMQVYKELFIGTAKPTEEELAQVKHYLINVASIKDHFDVSIYRKLAIKSSNKIHESNKPVIVVGGTGLYIRVLIHGIFESPPIGDNLRKSLRQKVISNGIESLYEELTKVDPISSEKLSSSDVVRILRALEFYYQTGKTISTAKKEHGFKNSFFNVNYICLCPDREILYERINTRTDLMYDNGLVDEVINLNNQGFSLDLRAFQAIGYRDVVSLIRKSIDKTEARRLTSRDTRRYAKRQLTWIRSEKNVTWHNDPKNSTPIIEIAKKFFKI